MKLIKNILSNITYVVGDFLCTIMLKYDWSFLYPVYNYLLTLSMELKDE